MPKRKVGRCAICGERRVLTFEHVPPLSAYNSGGPDWSTVGFMDWLVEYLDTGTKPTDIRPVPRGTGEKSICEKCNSFTGTEYVPSLKHLVDVGWCLARIIHEVRPAAAGECLT